MNTIVLLGRNGDIVNLLPLAHSFGKCNWVVAAEHAGIFEGTSYVEAIKYPRGPNHFNEACAWAKEKGYPNIIPAQVFTNPDKKKLTPSYAMEAWRLAGHLLDYRRWPLVFDRRDAVREAKLIEKVTGSFDSRPVVLVATRAMTSPFPKIPELLARLRGLNANIVDMGFVKADRIYDMLGLFEKAACLVTIDTLHLHLARASYCPVVSILADGWIGSIPPPQAQWRHHYQTGSLNLDGVIRNVQEILQFQKQPLGVCMAADIFNNVHPALSSWPNIPPQFIFDRDSRTQLNDDRPLPFMKDVLEASMNDRPEGELVVWTNCDTVIVDFEAIKEHARKWNFGCVRRSAGHIGRECFWFRRQWLKDNLINFPDVVLAAPKCDLVIAKWLRSFYGIPSSLESLEYDFPPVDLPPGIVYHEPHQSSWLPYQGSPSAVHNDRLWKMSYANVPTFEEEFSLVSPSLKKASVEVEFPDGFTKRLFL